MVPAPAGPADKAANLARFYLSARNATDPTERSRALANLLQADTGAEFRTLSTIAAPELALVTPDGLSPEQRLLLATAAAVVDAPSAAALRDSLKSTEPGAASPVDLIILDAIRATAAPDHPITEIMDRLLDTGDQVPQADRVRGQAAAAILFGLSDPGGAPLTSRQRARLAGLQAGPATHAAAIMVADAAVERGATGEVAILTLTSAASGERLGVSDRALLLRDLCRVGLSRQARSVALDGLTALMRH